MYALLGTENLEQALLLSSLPNGLAQLHLALQEGKYFKLDKDCLTHTFDSKKYDRGARTRRWWSRTRVILANFALFPSSYRVMDVHFSYARFPLPIENSWQPNGRASLLWFHRGKFQSLTLYSSPIIPSPRLLRWSRSKNNVCLV